MQIVQHLRVPADIGFKHVAGEVQGQPHRVAVVVVSDVMAPIHQRRILLTGMRAMPVVEIDHAVAAIDFDDRRDQCNHARTDVLDVRRIVHREPVSKFHQCGRCAGFDRVDRAGDVVDRCRLRDQLIGGGVVHADTAWVGELGQACIVSVATGE